MLQSYHCYKEGIWLASKIYILIFKKKFKKISINWLSFLHCYRIMYKKIMKCNFHCCIPQSGGVLLLLKKKHFSNSIFRISFEQSILIFCVNSIFNVFAFDMECISRMNTVFLCIPDQRSGRGILFLSFLSFSYTVTP